MTRIATSQLFNRSTAQMSSLNVEANRLQGQIASGKKLTAPSQDAAGWSQLATIKRSAADDKAAAANIDLASSILGQSDDALDGMAKQLQRAQELAIQANSGTLNADQRAHIATQLDGITEDLMRYANQKDVRGVPMFGGGADIAFATGPDGVTYVGGTAPQSIPAGVGNEVQVTEDGTRLAQMFATMATLSEAVRSGEGIGEAADGLTVALDTVSSVRGSVGARMMRLDMEMERMDDVALHREEARTAIEDTDISATITELQKTLTILSATQASFTKLSNLSLFDQIR